VTLKTVVIINGQAAKIHWVVDPLPTSGDVKVSDDAIRKVWVTWAVRAYMEAQLKDLLPRARDPENRRGDAEQQV
jgi:hypothetical protein